MDLKSTLYLSSERRSASSAFARSIREKHPIGYLLEKRCFLHHANHEALAEFATDAVAIQHPFLI